MDLRERLVGLMDQLVLPGRLLEFELNGVSVTYVPPGKHSAAFMVLRRAHRHILVWLGVKGPEGLGSFISGSSTGEPMTRIEDDDVFSLIEEAILQLPKEAVKLRSATTS